jgi:hypothetical protein
MILPSGVTTLVSDCLPAHPVLAFTCTQGCVYFSSPKNHAQPVGVFVERSIKETGNGAVPEVLLAVKLTIGGLEPSLTDISFSAKICDMNLSSGRLNWTGSSFTGESPVSFAGSPDNSIVRAETPESRQIEQRIETVNSTISFDNPDLFIR